MRDREQVSIGTSTFYRLPDTRPRAVVLFVHGLSGGPNKTWKRLPHLLMASQFGMQKDFVNYSFESSKWRPMGPCIQDLIEDLVSFIKIYLSGKTRIYVVAHSLGCVLALGAGVELAKQDIQLSRKLRGLVLLAPAIWGSRIAMISPNKVTRQLKPRSKILEGIRDDWAHHGAAKGIKAAVLFGSKDTLIQRQISDYRRLRIEPNSIEKGHVNLSKIEDFSEESYQAILSLLVRFDGGGLLDARRSVIQCVIDSEPEDWEYDDEDGEFVYFSDFGLRIIIERDEDGSPAQSSFKKHWTDNFPDKNAKLVKYRILYRGERIGRFVMIDCDGGRYILPLPKADDDLRISTKQYRLARVLDCSSMYEELDRGLEIARTNIDPVLDEDKRDSFL